MLLHNLNTLTLILNLSLKITQTQGLRCDPPKLRFENHTNKKTLKQAWRFFLLYDLFVTQAFGSSNFVEIIPWTYDY